MQTETPSQSPHALIELMQQGDAILAIVEDRVTHLYGHRDRLRQIVFAIQDVVWPGWFYHHHTSKNYCGRSIVTKYAENCDNAQGTIAVSNRNYKDKAWDQVLRILAAQGVIVFNETPEHAPIRDGFRAAHYIEFQKRAEAASMVGRSTTVEGLTQEPSNATT